jgi:hypothetical protein
MYVSLKNLPCSVAGRFSGMKGRYEQRQRTEIFQPELPERLVFVERLDEWQQINTIDIFEKRETHLENSIRSRESRVPRSVESFSVEYRSRISDPF